MDSMAQPAGGIRANTSPLKRSFDIAVASEPTLHRYHDRYAQQRTVSVSSALTAHRTRPYIKRRTASSPVNNSMLTQPTSIMSGPFPSFMTVYGDAKDNTYDHAQREQQQQQQQPHHIQTSHNRFPKLPSDSNTQTNATSHAPPSSIQRRGSATSATSYSTDSSPTTTNSTFDSPLMADSSGSPSSSPESASSAMPPKSFQSAIHPTDTIRTSTFSESKHPTFPPTGMSSTPAIDDARRNVKNLTLNMQLPSLTNPSSLGETDGTTHPFSAPTSPIREPPRTGRRKPTNLTIRTPGFNELTFGKALGTGLIPPTPGRKLSIPQPQSSPSLPSLASPIKGPAGGMHLALPNIAQHYKSDSHSSNSGSSVNSNLPSLREEEYQPPKSQEIQERGYTNGPVLIYDSGVYLYLEPTAEEASKFDVVVNVAKEIKDPFLSNVNTTDTVMSVWRNNSSDRRSIAEPQTAMSEKSFKSAFEWPAANSPLTPSPTTPRPLSTLPLNRPEYLHVRWDHNSEILEDLYPLCQIIDDRISKGKKVLIHCQLGVSRSASLTIAYGLYKGYEKDFHSMYMSVKKRSQWVGPNMSLIYQLTDFHLRCQRDGFATQSKKADPTWWVTDNTKTPTTVSESSSFGNSSSTASDKQTTGFVSEQLPLRLNKELPPVPLFVRETTPSNRPFSPLERSAIIQQPGPFPMLKSQDATKSAKRAAPRPLPFRERSHVSSQMTIPPHKPSQPHRMVSSQIPSVMDLAMQDVPSTPSLFSPRATEFMASPFGVTTAGDLVTSTPKQVKPPPGAFPGGSEWRQSIRFPTDADRDIGTILAHDPRSPPQISETKEILRNIDDVL